MSLSKTAAAVWDSLPGSVRENLVMSAWDIIRGKPPRTVRIAKFKAETIRAKVEVRRRLEK